MQTVLYSEHTRVTIDSQGPITIIGEKINPTGNPQLVEALQAGDLTHVHRLAQRQIEAGAEVLDVNVGHPQVEEVRRLPQVIQYLQQSFDIPLAIDSADPAAMKAGLEAVRGRCLVNSVSGHQSSLERLLPLVAEHRAAVIGLTLDEQGIPVDVDQRLRVAEKILEAAVGLGLSPSDVLIDPLVLAVASDDQSALAALSAIQCIRQTLDVNVVLGASNVSFGLPQRLTVNRTFAAMAAFAGASAVITDPAALAPLLRAADLLLGRDAYAARYLAQYRRAARQDH
jgi:5-methyltetrahydrofolate--homocysteine methyltransferase